MTPLPGPPTKEQTKLAQRRDQERASKAMEAMRTEDKMSHRAAKNLIDQAARESAYRYAAVTGWCGKVGTP